MPFLNYSDNKVQNQGFALAESEKKKFVDTIALKDKNFDITKKDEGLNDMGLLDAVKTHFNDIKVGTI